jgi:hypothetical protein
MTVIVTDAGFAADDFTGAFVPLAEAGAGVSALELGPADHAEALAGRLEGVGAIRVLFPAFNDGRGFTIARRLRFRRGRDRRRSRRPPAAGPVAIPRRLGQSLLPGTAARVTAGLTQPPGKAIYRLFLIRPPQ